MGPTGNVPGELGPPLAQLKVQVALGSPQDNANGEQKDQKHSLKQERYRVK